MALAAGSRLGAYEVLSSIGRGGMGEVYRARDPRLGREVAVKVLPPSMSSDPERLRRFEQEARAAAALNHPNIVGVHDIGAHDGAPYIVSELLEGETLRERLTRGGSHGSTRHVRTADGVSSSVRGKGSSLSVRKAIDYAVQSARGLAAAHEQGIIHRDLKPENIFVAGEGRIKILDFGLAKLTQLEAAAAGETAVSTTSPQTQPGFVLGTVGYMSPEQVRGVPADHRADIFALGAVLYEMLSGRRAFQGDTAADTMTAILKEDPPDLLAVDPQIPPALARIVGRCLEKHPAARFQSAGDLAFALEGLSGQSGPAEVLPRAAPGRPTHARIAWTLVIVLLAALAGVLAKIFVRQPTEVTRTFRFSISPPEDWSLAVGVTTVLSSTAPLAVSPDGWQVAFVAQNREGKRLLWIRSRDLVTPRSLVGTDGATSPFWSPDSRFLGFFADGKLKKIDIAGGPPVTLCAASAGVGGAWSQRGIIVFSPSRREPLQKVSAAGGEPMPAMATERGAADTIRPTFLPDGIHYLYSSRGERGYRSYIASLESTDRISLLQTDSSNVLYSQGHLVFVRDRTLMAQPFDTRRLTLLGEPVPIAEQIQVVGGNAVFSASPNGVLVYQIGQGTGRSQLTWFDRTGKVLSLMGEPNRYGDVQLSPDGTRAAVSVLDPADNTSDIWLFDIARGLGTRFTMGPDDDVAPVWSPDGSRIVFSSRRAGQPGIYQRLASGAGAEERLLGADSAGLPASWSHDGRVLLLFKPPSLGGEGGLWVLPLYGDRKPHGFVTSTNLYIFPGSFSPDGRWVAYVSNETGRTEVYAAPFPGPGARTIVSTGGGRLPRWSARGQEIVYVDLVTQRFMSAPVTSREASLQVGSVRALFDGHVAGGRTTYDITGDGQRFLVSTNESPEQTAAPPPLTVVVNWPAELKK